MKTLGLIGGTGWVSTVDYYKLINELVNEKLGGVHAAKLILYSLNFGEIKSLLDINDWDSISRIYIDIAIKLKQAGADCIILAANTPHLIADKIKQAVQLPFIHIAEATAKAIKETGIKKVALLGTRFTMENSFYTDALAAKGISTLVPNEAERNYIHNSILNEMVKDVFTEASKATHIEIINRLISEGAEGVVYACTEIPILLKNTSIAVTTFDTTLIHAKAAVAFALD
ncbi:aspartate racemase [Niastella koreensis]|uniref:Aspartate racemase n=2 Tax=Niastella koreensis TaxID=354356 RepID=G8TH62_NIAKG|nr:aspartate/glutamate racemase family protein [Niastella koreensis]AEW01672.1 aspartate racemase [Niastella koreensis GR20-10]OQP48386.1 aspartate racemase [Niastella koreensis]